MVNPQGLVRSTVATNQAAHAATTELPHKQLHVILASGDEDGGRRATVAFSAACSALAMGYEVVVFMVGDGMCWGIDGHADYFHAAGYPPLNHLLDNFISSGGHLYKCANALEPCSPSTQDHSSHQHLRPEIQLMGFATFIDQIGGSSVITF